MREELKRIIEKIESIEKARDVRILEFDKLIAKRYNEILEENPEIDEILPVMDKIQRYSRILEELEENYDEGFDSYGSST